MSNDKGKKPGEIKEPRRALGRGLDALLPVTQNRGGGGGEGGEPGPDGGHRAHLPEARPAP
ncbi:MAG: hypothetical protein IPN17_28685 [Deltaproteobacteria bacterium]|nr:hypothetical protein [Deltaproteobacteria bacterium]